MIEIWGRRSSSNVQKVIWALAELGVEFKRHTVGGSFGGTSSETYRAMNPNGLVPVMRDGDIIMFESNAIVRYLGARYGEGKLRPTKPEALAAAEQWMEWQTTTPAPLISQIFWNNVRLPAAQRDGKVVASAEDKLVNVLAIADRRLASVPYFAGDHFSMGDIVMGVMYWRFLGIECRHPDMSNLAAWIERLKTRKPFQDWVMVPPSRNVEEWEKNEKLLA